MPGSRGGGTRGVFGSGWVLLACIGSWFGGGGCGVDLLVGQTQMGTTAAGSSTGPLETTASPPIGATDDGTSTGEPGTTSTVDTTEGEVPEGTSGTTTTGPLEEGTTGDVACPGLSFPECSEIAYCLWFGTRERGECALSPCEDPGNECLELPLGACERLLPCAWVGDPKLGECAAIECVPCEILSIDQCMEVSTCEWLEVMEVCVA